MKKPAVSSPTRERVFEFIVRFKSEHDGNSPSIRQIMAECYIASTSYVTSILARLVTDGRIELFERAGTKRLMIGVSGGQWVYKHNLELSAFARTLGESADTQSQ